MVLKNIILLGCAFLQLVATAQELPSIDSSILSDLAGALVENDCDNSPEALTAFFGKEIPQICIDVPFDDGSMTTTIERCYYSYLPESCGEGPFPLVFDIHGWGSCPLSSAQYTGWLQKAEEECFAIVWPIGNTDPETFVAPNCWNVPGIMRDEDYSDNTMIPCCCFQELSFQGVLSPPQEPDDPLFLRMIVDSEVDLYAQKGITIDYSRVYMAGHSNGCFASLAMAALHSDVVAAVCCHAGTVVTPFPEDYIPVPIWIANAKNDLLIDYQGQNVLDAGPFGRFGVWAFDEIVSYLGNQNGCSSTLVEEAVEGSEGTLYSRASNCTNDAIVEYVLLEQSGHFPYPVPHKGTPFDSWAGGAAESGLAFSAVDTTSMAWEFCKAQRNPYQEERMRNEEPKPTIEEPISGATCEGLRPGMLIVGFLLVALGNL